MKKSILKLSLIASLFTVALIPFVGGVLPAIATTLSVSLASSLFNGLGIVALVINPSDLSWHGKEIMSINEAIFESVFVNPNINDFHTIVPGIQAKQQIAYLGLLGLVGKSGAACNPEADTNTIPMSEKFWLPADIVVRFEDCWKDLKQVFFVWSKKMGIKAADLTNTDYLNFVQDRLTTGVEEAKIRFTWFGDTAAANFSGSPAGIITDGTSTSYFDAIDGIWKQIFDVVTGTPARLVAIARNANAAYSTQEFATADTTNKVAHAILQGMIDAADFRLKDRDDKMFIVTWSIYNQYKKELKNYSAVESSYELVQDGKKVLMFDGVPVVPFSFWDRTIRTYHDNGTKWYRPHRAVLTTKANLQIGVESESAFGEIGVFYAPFQKLNVSEALWKMDAKLVEDYMFVTAY